jgi:protoheme IX farnesyltransferase
VSSVKVASYRVLGVVLRKVEDYKLLIKFRLSLTVVFSSVMAYLIAANGPVNAASVVILAMGGLLVTGAANALNQVLEKDYDRLMKRTANRPLATGRMSVSEAVIAAGFMSLFGISLLALFNPWTAFFGTFAMMSYAFVYTPLKRISPVAVAVGAVPGALPTLIGCAAAQGEITLLALSLFTMQFLWQFPHFFSIGWLGFDDYKKAGYQLIPAEDLKPHPVIGKQALLYTLFLLPISVLPYWVGASSVIATSIVFAVGMAYAWFAWRFFQKLDRSAALRLMFFSFLYIPTVLIVLVLDKL